MMFHLDCIYLREGICGLYGLIQLIYMKTEVDSLDNYQLQ